MQWTTAADYPAGVTPKVRRRQIRFTCCAQNAQPCLSSQLAPLSASHVCCLRTVRVYQYCDDVSLASQDLLAEFPTVVLHLHRCTTAVRVGSCSRPRWPPATPTRPPTSAARSLTALVTSIRVRGYFTACGPQSSVLAVLRSALETARKVAGAKNRDIELQVGRDIGGMMRRALLDCHHDRSEGEHALRLRCWRPAPVGCVHTRPADILSACVYQIQQPAVAGPGCQ